MSNKRKYTMNPTRIDNYNKFLKTLDNVNSSNNDTGLRDVQPNLSVEDIIKEEIDKIIENIDNHFKLNNMSSCCFTGQNLLENNVEDNYNPNDYIDFFRSDLNAKMRKIISSKRSSKLTKNNCDTQVEIKETININVEINNISDLLTLIDTYKVDPSIQYNINIKALHKIKEHLEELNNMIGMKDLHLFTFQTPNIIK